MTHCSIKSQFEPQPYPEQVGLSRKGRKVFKIFLAAFAVISWFFSQDLAEQAGV